METCPSANAIRAFFVFTLAPNGLALFQRYGIRWIVLVCFLESTTAFDFPLLYSLTPFEFSTERFAVALAKQGKAGVLDKIAMSLPNRLNQ